MSKCLVTKLKASVNNPDLPIFGAVEITLLPESNPDIRGSIKTCAGQSATLLFSDGTKVEINETKDYNFGDITTPTKVLFISKYEAFPTSGSTNYFTATFNVDDFKNTSLNIPRFHFDHGSLIGNIENLGSHPELKQICLHGSHNLTGNLANLTRLFPNLIYLDINGSGIGGNIAECGKWNLITLYFSDATTGNIYDAIVGWRTKKENNELNVLAGGFNVKLFDTILPNATMCHLTWTDTTASVEIKGITTTYDNNGNVIS